MAGGGIYTNLKPGGITLYGNGTHFMLLKPPHQIPIRFATYPFYHHWWNPHASRRTTRPGKHTKNYGKSSFCSWINQLFLWPCSIAMLNYQRVYRWYPSESCWKSHDFLLPSCKRLHRCAKPTMKVDHIAWVSLHRSGWLTPSYEKNSLLPRSSCIDAPNAGWRPDFGAAQEPCWIWRWSLRKNNAGQIWRISWT